MGIHSRSSYQYWDGLVNLTVYSISFTIIIPRFIMLVIRAYSITNRRLNNQIVLFNAVKLISDTSQQV